MKKQLALAVCLGGMLVGGCSSKPDVGDVKGMIKEAWKPCNVVELDSIKKTNGIERGDTYQMAITYELEITKDVANVKFFDANCPSPMGDVFAKYFIETPGSGHDFPFKKGEILTVSPVYIMVKSENGWVQQ